MLIYRSLKKAVFAAFFLLSGCISGQSGEVSLPPASPDSIRSIIAYLASDELEGRDVGTIGLEKAEGYIIGRYQFLNLAPAGENNTYVQSFSYAQTRSGGLFSNRKEIPLHNLVAKIPGHGADKDEYIVLMAHYDHVGRGDLGRSTSRQVGETHHGADDNASGTAALLELARIFSEKPVNNRTILFLATSGEEEGDLGSKAWMKNPTVPVDKVKAVMNFDMVGRMKDNQVALIAAYTSPAFNQWPGELKNPHHLEILSIYPYGGTPDDLATFTRAKIPGVEFWTGYHPDYHAPNDVVEKINFEGESWIVDMAAQAVLFIDKTPEKALVFQSSAATQPATAPAATQPGFSRVVIGIRAGSRLIEGFYGVPVATVTPDSPASAAGLQAGDVLLQINNRMIYSSRDLTTILNTLTPNKPVPLKIRRDKTTMDLTITPLPREE